MANLKKQRAQSRTSNASENGSLVTSAQGINSNYPVQPMELSLTSNDLQTPSITKFSGVTSDVVSDSTRSRRCCAVMWTQKYSFIANNNKMLCGNINLWIYTKINMILYRLYIKTLKINLHIQLLINYLRVFLVEKFNLKTKIFLAVFDK